MNVPIAFYLPRADWPPFARLPTADEMSQHPRRFLSPALNWTWRTYAHLAAAGFPCRLVDELPDAGVIVAAACNLPLFFRPGPRRLIVCCVADSPAPFFTQLNIYQCQTQATAAARGGALPRAAYMPHWPQPGLLPRAADRGARFENVDFFGAEDQLATEIRSPDFIRAVEALGIHLRLHFEHYHDYRTTDAVLAIRRTGGEVIRHKPGSKLINAWLAGVPAILGVEAGFRELRRHPEDYLECNSAENCLLALRRLRDDPGLRARMTANGAARAAEFSPAALTERWQELLLTEVSAAYASWIALRPLARPCFYLRQYRTRFSVSLRRRLGWSTEHPAP